MTNEKYILGAFIQWQDKLLSVVDFVSENHFINPKSILLFRQIKSLFEKKIAISISTIGAVNNDSDFISYAMECVDHAASKQPFESHFEILEEDYTNRQLKMFLANSLNLLNNKEIGVSEIQTGINDIALKAVKESEYSHGHSVMDFWQSVKERGLNKDKMRGMRTPWKAINDIINNLQKGRTYIIGGLKKTGKSRFAIHLTSGLLQDGHSGLWFSMEMQPFAIHACILASRTDTDTNNLHSGQIIQRNMESLVEKSGSYMNEPLYISNKSSVSPAYVSTVIKSRKHKGRVDFVVIDYVQRMRGRVTSKGNRVEELENIMADLSDIARDENIALIILSQLSGEAEKKTGNPVYSYFKGSQAILECADTAIVLTDANRGEPTSPLQDHKEIDAMIIQRDGVSDVEINFNAYLQYSKFVETIREKKKEGPAKGRI
jgi:replicative DNA helicase